MRKELWLRLGAGLLISALLVAAVGLLPQGPDRGKRTDGLYYQATGIHPDAELLTIDGRTVEAEEYLYWLAYDCEYILSNAGQVDWDEPLTEEMTFGQYAKTDALETTKLFAVIRGMAEEYGVTLTPEDEAELQQHRESLVNYYGSEEAYARQVELMGISQGAYDRINATYYLLDHLSQMAGQEGSPLYPGREALDDFAARESYVTARLLFFPAAGMDEETLIDQRELAADYAAQLAAAEDPYALLGQLAADLGVDLDHGDVTLSLASGEDELLPALAALEVNAPSGVIEVSDGLYLAVRRALDEETVLQDYFTQRLLQARSDVSVQFSPLYDSIDTGSFYTGLLEARRALGQVQSGN